MSSLTYNRNRTRKRTTHVSKLVPPDQLYISPYPLFPHVPPVVPVSLFFKNEIIRRVYINNHMDFYGTLPNLPLTGTPLAESRFPNTLNNFIRSKTNNETLLSNIYHSQTGVYLSILINSIVNSDGFTKYSIIGIQNPIYRSIANGKPEFVHSVIKPVVLEWLALSTLWSKSLDCKAILTGGSAEWFYTLNDTSNSTSDYDIKIIEKSGGNFTDPYLVFKQWLLYVEILKFILNNSFKTIEKLAGKMSSFTYQFSTRIISSDKRYPSSEITPEDVFQNHADVTLQYYTYLMSLYCHISNNDGKFIEDFKILDLLLNDEIFQKIENYRFDYKEILPSDLAYKSFTVEGTYIDILSYPFIINDMKNIIYKCADYFEQNAPLNNPCHLTGDFRDQLIRKYVIKANNINKNNMLIENLANITRIKPLQNMKRYDIIIPRQLYPILNDNNDKKIHRKNNNTLKKNYKNNSTNSIANIELLKFIHNIKSGTIMGKNTNKRSNQQLIDDQKGFVL